MKRILASLLLLPTLAGCGGSSPASSPAPATNTAPAVSASPQPVAGLPIPGTDLYVAQIASDRIEIRTQTDRTASVPAPAAKADVWTHFGGQWIALVTGPVGGYNPNGKVYRIDLPSGAVHDLGAIIGPPFRLDLRAAATGPYLAWKRAAFGDCVEIIDLQTGERRHPDAAESHLTGLRWAPTAPQVAVRAAEPKSGMPVQIGANYMDGATHLDVINLDGHVTHLHPHEPLQLVQGPVWSPDSKWLAVTAGVVKAVGKGEGGGSEFRSTDIWLVEVGANRWVHLRAMKENEGDITAPIQTRSSVSSASSATKKAKRSSQNCSSPNVSPPQVGRP